MGWCRKKPPPVPALTAPPPRDIVPIPRVDAEPRPLPTPVSIPAIPKLDLAPLKAKLQLGIELRKGRSYREASDIFTELINELFDKRSELKNNKTQKLLATALHELALTRSDIHNVSQEVSDRERPGTQNTIKLEKRFLAMQREWHGQNSLKLSSTIYDIGMLYEILQDKDNAKKSFEDIIRIGDIQKAQMTPQDKTMRVHCERLLRKYREPSPAPAMEAAVRAPSPVDRAPPPPIPSLDLDTIDDSDYVSRPQRDPNDEYTEKELAREEWGIRRRESLDRPVREWGINIDTPNHATPLQSVEKQAEWGSVVHNTIDIDFDLSGSTDSEDPDDAFNRSYARTGSRRRSHRGRRHHSTAGNSTYSPNDTLLSARQLRAQGPHFAAQAAKGLENEWGVPTPRGGQRGRSPPSSATSSIGRYQRRALNTSAIRDPSERDSYGANTTPYRPGYNGRSYYDDDSSRDDSDNDRYRRGHSRTRSRRPPVHPNTPSRSGAPTTPRGWDKSVTSLQTRSNVVPDEWGTATPRGKGRYNYTNVRYDDTRGDERLVSRSEGDPWFDHDYARDARDKDDSRNYSRRREREYDDYYYDNDRYQSSEYERRGDRRGESDNMYGRSRHRDFDLDHDPPKKSAVPTGYAYKGGSNENSTEYSAVTRDGWKASYD